MTADEPERDRLEQPACSRRVVVVPALVAVLLVGVTIWLVAAKREEPVGEVVVPSASPQSDDERAESPVLSATSFPHMPVAVNTDPPPPCPVTIPAGDFDPPDRYHPDSDQGEWYGSEDLWLILADNGEVWLPDRDGHVGRRLFLWSVHQGEPGDEPHPNVELTAERLDGDAPLARGDDWTTHGWTSSPTGRNLFMIASIALPTPGCWEITAKYRGASLSWVIWAAGKA